MPAADRVEWARDVLAAVDGLEPTRAALVRMVYFNGLTVRQAAAHSGDSVVRVRQELSAALRELAPLV